MRRNLILVAILFAGCRDDLCSRHSDCPAGSRCSDDSVCVVTAPVTEADAGVDVIDDAVADAVADAESDASPVDAQLDAAQVTR